ncbi:MAG: L-lactate dehydrogenase [Firmicutes bacterium HGW-Firmicutes-20]|nr:MAG: L-lactate dehydrogenase [Firmicutes bacterium HGW-Firmicutes-20]PKM68947.1 MAG: L-lactate dehydrogenase [Firmicutes bacterium HGW-Firmicutes-19]
MLMKTNKISIIGAGFVGSTSAFAILDAGLASDIVLVDINREKAEAEAMDLSHGAAFVKTVNVIAGDLKDTANSDLVIITAGIGPKPGETRLDVLNKNIPVFKDIIPKLASFSPNSILLVVSNPVDILTYLTYQYSGFPANRVIGSGTVLDTSRFKSILSKQFDIDARNIHAYIIGEHGDSEIASWSLTKIAGMSVDEYCRIADKNCKEEFKEAIQHEVKHAAYEIINRKGYTNYAVALAVRRISEAILHDEQSILTVSGLLQNVYDISDVYLAMPCVVGKDGISKILTIPLSDDEIKQLQHSANLLKEIIKDSHIDD